MCRRQHAALVFALMFTLSIVIFAFAKRDVNIRLALDDSALLDNGDLIAKVTLTNPGYRSMTIQPALAFSIRALSHYEYLTTTWQDTQRDRLKLRPFQKVTREVNLGDILWKAQRDMFRSDLIGPHRELAGVLPRGKYSVTCAAALPGSKHTPTFCGIESNAVELSVPSDFGGRIEYLRKTLADPDSTRESLREALEQARVWKANEAVEQICERLLHDSDEQTRRLCAHVLCWIADDAAIPHLIEGLQDGSRYVRRQCYQALIAMAPERQRDEYEPWRQWWIRSGKRQSQIPWGQPNENLQMRITTSRTTYFQGEDVKLNVMFRTVYNSQVLLPSMESESPEANADTAFYTLEVADKSGRPISLVKAETRLDMCHITHYGVSFAHMRKGYLPLNEWKMRTEAGERNLTHVPGVYTLTLTFSPIHSDKRLWSGTLQSNPLTISILSR